MNCQVLSIKYQNNYQASIIKHQLPNINDEVSSINN